MKAGDYKAFETQETKTHPSEGPHTSIDLPVKVFMNDTIAVSLTAGNDEHPAGSGIVKEMYTEAGELSGSQPKFAAI